ncbi:MAG: hypothetical protein ACRD5F_08435 [Candidatus Acidiferrales bacterium]
MVEVKSQKEKGESKKAKNDGPISWAASLLPFCFYLLTFCLILTPALVGCVTLAFLFLPFSFCLFP